MKVNEIFVSIDGEVNAFYQGRLSTFVRLQGCNLNCGYCDTIRAQDVSGGKEIDPKKLYDEIVECDTRKITFTGGEPLLQSDELLPLIHFLVDDGKLISVETNGSLKVIPITNVSYIMDYKLESSGESRRMTIENFYDLGPRDFVKFVIANLDDYIEAREVMQQIEYKSPCVNFAMSPVIVDPKAPSNIPKWLVGLIIEDRLDVVFNYQLHKILEVD